MPTVIISFLLEFLFSARNLWMKPQLLLTTTGHLYNSILACNSNWRRIFSTQIYCYKYFLTAASSKEIIAKSILRRRVNEANRILKHFYRILLSMFCDGDLGQNETIIHSLKFVEKSIERKWYIKLNSKLELRLVWAFWNLHLILWITKYGTGLFLHRFL